MNCCLWPPGATCRHPHRPIARHRPLARRAASTAANPTKPTKLASTCIPRCPRSCYLPAMRGRDGLDGEMRFHARQLNSGKPHTRELPPPEWSDGATERTISHGWKRDESHKATAHSEKTE